MFKNVIIIGCGGIGSHLIGPLVQYLCSLSVDERPKELTLIDGDSYEESNLDRQSFHASKVGQNKADVQAERLNVLYTNLMDFYSIDEYLGAENVAEAQEIYKGRLKALVASLRGEYERSMEPEGVTE